MKITRLHVCIALLTALLLHSILVMWLVFPTKKSLPKLDRQIVHVSLQSLIAKNTSIASAPIAKSLPKPIQESKLRSKSLTKTLTQKPKQVVQKLTPTPTPTIEPIAKPIETTKTTQKTAKVPIETNTEIFDAIASAKYEQLLKAWLEKHKKYPKNARRMRIEGEGTLRIVINRAGQVQQATLDKSTGNRLLDKAILKMVKDANPFPVMSKSDSRTLLEFITPIIFSIQ